MKLINVLIKAVFIFLVVNVYSQQKQDSIFSGYERISYSKDTIFLEFKKNKGRNTKYRGVKFYKTDEKGIVFNHLSKGSFLYETNIKSDTLCLLHLKDYNIISIEEVEKRERDFRERVKKKLPLNYKEKLYQFYRKNDIFITYLIEVLEKEEKFVVYPVVWRNQNFEPKDGNSRYKIND